MAFDSQRMKPGSKVVVLRLLCWTLIVMAPTAAICCAAGIHNVGILGVALPFILISEWVFRARVRRCKLSGMPAAEMQTGVELIGAAHGSRFAQSQIESHRRLAPTADAERSTMLP